MDFPDSWSSPKLVPNPFIKKRNLDWDISPPPLKRKPRQRAAEKTEDDVELIPSTRKQSSSLAPSAAAIEAGRAHITEHATHFSEHLAQHLLDPYPKGYPQLSISAYKEAYEKALHNRHGAHFVIHQHNHPIAGPHYDLRLQINGTSSASWAIMYGPPGDPNSSFVRSGNGGGRNAIETRIHCLWNHLIETASAATGSLLIWDTGTYEVLPRKPKTRRQVVRGETDEDESDSSALSASPDGESGRRKRPSEQDKLRAAFTARSIRLRLHGSRLPRNYTVHLWLTTADDIDGRARAVKATTRARTRRRRRRALSEGVPTAETSESSEAEPEMGLGQVSEATPGERVEEDESPSQMERELRELEDEKVRRTNAYPGASNTIGSIHQRRWFLALDKEGSGFVKRRKDGVLMWEELEDKGRKKLEGSIDDGDDHRLTYPFYIRGPDHERSVVTGRLSEDIIKDEGVVGFVPRRGWRPRH
ncbi:hypothetical protein VTK73DRAFT_6544 [Phialemonium thermophilum]|uniref:DNA ligase D 3'-phosphoesterase domain-containing protein n=1 Tax=Phialemonium thermophilum TaxID=223376 RepID=A0ABR3XWR5_9PEZI